MDIEPKFHEDASKLEELVPFEECLELHSSDPAIVRIPEYLLLTHNGRTFKLVTLRYHTSSNSRIQACSISNLTFPVAAMLLKFHIMISICGMKRNASTSMLMMH